MRKPAAIAPAGGGGRGVASGERARILVTPHADAVGQVRLQQRHAVLAASGEQQRDGEVPRHRQRDVVLLAEHLTTALERLREEARRILVLARRPELHRVRMISSKTMDVDGHRALTN